jgi:hypothetical protein
MHGKKSERFDGTLHLLEVPYKELPMFDFGILDIACTSDQFHEWTMLIPHQQFLIDIKADDGRLGFCRRITSQTSGEYVVAAVVFVSEFCLPDAPPRKTAFSIPEN